MMESIELHERLPPSFFSDEPPPRVFFQVVIKYNAENKDAVKNIAKENLYLESEYLKNFPTAYEIAEGAAQDISSRFLKSEIGEDEEDFAIYILDTSAREIAKIGILAVDLRTHTLH